MRTASGPSAPRGIHAVVDVEARAGRPVRLEAVDVAQSRANPLRYSRTSSMARVGHPLPALDELVAHAGGHVPADQLAAHLL